jgi:hypothetical protein
MWRMRERQAGGGEQGKYHNFRPCYRAADDTIGELTHHGGWQELDDEIAPAGARWSMKGD